MSEPIEEIVARIERTLLNMEWEDLRALIASWREHYEREQKRREMFAEILGVPDHQNVSEGTPFEELYHRAGKLTRAELEASWREWGEALKQIVDGNY